MSPERRAVIEALEAAVAAAMDRDPRGGWVFLRIDNQGGFDFSMRNLSEATVSGLLREFADCSSAGLLQLDLERVS